MTDDITSLQIRIRYLEVQQADRALGGLENAASKSSKSLVKWAAVVGAATTAAAGLRAVVQKTREFQVMQASLESATGSIENMHFAWDALVEFATKTPYSLDQAVNGFVKLVNLGLTPSERALASYGETASAMGKDLSQMIEAVADASTGEFERLKEFGIKASKQGDEITFTFRGVKTTVKNEAAEIEKFLIELGENNFAGSMQKRMDTLDGAISNLGDTWDQLLFAIGQEGIGDAAEDGIRGITEALDDLKSSIESGELGVLFDNFFRQIAEQGGGVAEVFREATNAVLDFVGESEVSAAEWEARWQQGFNNFPASIGYIVKRAGVELGTFVVIAGTIATEAAAAFTANFLAGVDKIRAYMQEFKSRLPGQADFDFGAAMRGIDAEFNDARIKQGEAAKGELDAAFDIRDAELQALTDELNASYAKTDDAIKRAEKLRFEFDNPLYGPAAPGTSDPNWEDRLAGFGVLPPKPEGGGPTTGNGGGTGTGRPSGGGSGGGSGDSEFQKLQKSLADQEELVASSYARRLEIIEQSTRDGSAIQMELELTLTEQWEAEQQRRIDILKKNPESMREAFELEEELIKESYERRKEIILQTTEITEKERQALLKKLEAEYRRAQEKSFEANLTSQLDAWGNLFGSLEAMGEAYGKRGFEIQKAASIANAIVSGIEATIHAYKEGTKISAYGGPIFAAVAAAATGAQIGALMATEYSGAHATGGMIPAGKWGVVGEAGAEVVRGPAIVSSAQATADHYGSGGGGGSSGGSNVQITVINQAPGVETEIKESGDNENRRIEMIIKRIDSDIRKGGTPLAKSIEASYNLKRHGR